MSLPTKSFAVLGAGITGLTAAHRLVQQGCRVRVFERLDRIGGSVATERIDGWLIERGPNSVLEGEPAMSALIKELGLESKRQVANQAAKKRFIVRYGQVLPTPMGPGSFFGTNLFSFGAKCRIMGELFQRRRTRPTDVSLEQLVCDHFGPEIVAYGLNPFVGGVYAGIPAKLSAQHSFPAVWNAEREHGSIIRGMIAAAKARKARGEPRGGIISFEGGLQTLIDTLGSALPAGAVTLNAQVERLQPGPRWTVTWRDSQGEHSEEFDGVLSALPAAGLAALRIGAGDERPLALLGEIEQPPVASLFLGYRREQVQHPVDGFGALIPAAEKFSMLGVLFSSTLFPRRAPDGHVALTVMVGGARQPEIAHLEPAALLRRVQPELQQLLGVTGEPVFQRHSLWPRAIPQYNLGYERFLTAMDTVEQAHPGFWLGGQARDGIAMPACLAAGEKLAARALGR